MKVHGLPEGQGMDLDCWVDMTRATCQGHINPVVQALAREQSINHHSI